ncbi:MAG TPA: PQQ-binding-like beta-propeller repeat protein [Vicinamibacterales bacterium]|nr:PQQ-binding-like beta-propeller repeat protein [Vicinamibacterales bacterium]
MFVKAGLITGLLIALAVPAPAQQRPDGAAVFKQTCATCHGENQTTAPTPAVLRQMTPESIFNSLTLGRMQIQAISLSEAEQRAVSEFLTGKTFAPVAPPVVVNKCTATPPMRAPANTGEWSSWGGNVANTRYQKNGGLTAADLPKLKLKWAFGYSVVTSARAQPTIAGGRLFVASENSEVHALDPKTGCTYWTYKAQGGVRSALAVGPYKNGARSGQAVFFGDSRANAYAVDANTGQQIWVRKVDDHKFAGITGAPTYHDGRLFVPVQGLSEEGQGGQAKYECCTFRGSVSALNANTGEVLWKRYTIDEPKPRARNKNGVQQWGPAGGGIWSSPTIDTKRGMVYIATGNNYADPSQKTTDAVIALDLKSGTIKWVNQITPNDNWTLGCRPENPDNPNCPAKMGPDYDFSASPSLVTVNGKDLLVLPQKSGVAYALDPDKEGEIAWQYRIGQGSGLGGQWGGAVDEQQAYFGVSDLLSPKPGGIRAVNLATGALAWSVEPQERLCDPKRPTCRASQGAAVTVIPGAVFSGSLDGGMRAYSTKDGSILWTFDTNKEFPTINGVKANGGGLEGPGAIVSGGMLYFNSGYGGFVGNPGNVLLAFGID